MRRREFITLLGGAAAAWPLAARAQQGEQLRRVGVLLALAEDDPEAKSRLAAFRLGLAKRGWSEGSNVRRNPHLGTRTLRASRWYSAFCSLAPTR